MDAIERTTGYGIETEALNLWYGDFQALYAVSAGIQPGIITALIGPSGCGKTTLRKAALWDEVKDRLKSSALGLSGGQQQRLCIARALASNPDVLLMDEPCSALDPIATGRIEDLMEEIKIDHTIVIVTHNMQQAARISDYTAFLYMGDLIEYGPTESIFTNPREERTEAYVTGRFG